MSDKERRITIRMSDALHTEIKNLIGEGTLVETESQFIRIAISEKIAKYKGCA